MRVVWVPQWAVLPVIVEDQAMVEGHGQGQQGPLTGQSADVAEQSRVNALGNHPDTCKFSSPLLALLNVKSQ